MAGRRAAICKAAEDALVGKAFGMQGTQHTGCGSRRLERSSLQSSGADSHAWLAGGPSSLQGNKGGACSELAAYKTIAGQEAERL